MALCKFLKRKKEEERRRKGNGVDSENEVLVHGSNGRRWPKGRRGLTAALAGGARESTMHSLDGGGHQ
jgi:hypothetical protein